MDATTAIGTGAAVLTTFSSFPQLRKAWVTGSTGDLSLNTFLMLFTGVALWTLYGWLRQDWVVLAANAVGTLGLGGILWLKLRETVAGRQRSLRRTDG